MTWMTPGHDGGDRVISAVIHGKRRTIAHVYGRTEEERDANARLMAAAPRLRKALEGLVDAIDGVTDQFDVEVRAARDALAEAEGREGGW